MIDRDVQCETPDLNLVCQRQVKNEQLKCFPFTLQAYSDIVDHVKGTDFL